MTSHAETAPETVMQVLVPPTVAFEVAERVTETLLTELAQFLRAGSI